MSFAFLQLFVLTQNLTEMMSRNENEEEVRNKECTREPWLPARCCRQDDSINVGTYLKRRVCEDDSRNGNVHDYGLA